MSDSVAPKERINIVYQPKTGGLPAGKELPLKLAIVGDFTLRKDVRPIEQRPPVSINKSNFNEVMTAHTLSLDVTIHESTGSNTVASEQSSKEEGSTNEQLVHLTFEGIKDFTPDSIVRKVPALKKLLDMREALKFLRGPLGNNREFKRRLETIVADPKFRHQLLTELGIVPAAGDVADNGPNRS